MENNDMHTIPKALILEVYARAQALRKYGAERCLQIAAEALGIDVEVVRQVVYEAA